MQLSLDRRVDVDDRKRLVVLDPSPTGDPLLDGALAVVAQRAGKKPSAVLGALGKGLRGQLYARLAAAGVLRSEPGKVLGLFPRTSWPTASAEHETAVRRGLEGPLVHGLTPDPRSAALVALLHALRSTHKVVVPKEHELKRRELDRRAKEIAEGSWGSTGRPPGRSTRCGRRGWRRSPRARQPRPAGAADPLGMTSSAARVDYRREYSRHRPPTPRPRARAPRPRLAEHRRRELCASPTCAAASCCSTSGPSAASTACTCSTSCARWRRSTTASWSSWACTRRSSCTRPTRTRCAPPSSATRSSTRSSTTRSWSPGRPTPPAPGRRSCSSTRRATSSRSTPARATPTPSTPSSPSCARSTGPRARCSPAARPTSRPPCQAGDLRFPAKAVALPGGGFLVADAGHHSLVELAADAETVVRRIGSGERGLVDGERAVLQRAQRPVPAARRRRRRGRVRRRGRRHRQPRAARRRTSTTGTVRTLAGNGRQLVPGEDGGALSSPWDVAWWQDRVWVAMAGVHQLWTFDPRTGAVEVAGRHRQRGAARRPARRGLVRADLRASPRPGTGCGSRTARPPACATSRPGRCTPPSAPACSTSASRTATRPTALLQHPLGVTVLPDGSVAVCDTYNGAVRRSADGRVTTIATGLAEPSGAVVDGDHLVVVESAAHRLTRVSLAGVAAADGFAHTTQRPVTEIAGGRPRDRRRLHPAAGAEGRRPVRAAVPAVRLLDAAGADQAGRGPWHRPRPGWSHRRGGRRRRAARRRAGRLLRHARRRGRGLPPAPAGLGRPGAGHRRRRRPAGAAPLRPLDPAPWLPDPRRPGACRRRVPPAPQAPGQRVLWRPRAPGHAWCRSRPGGRDKARTLVESGSAKAARRPSFVARCGCADRRARPVIGHELRLAGSPDHAVDSCRDVPAILRNPLLSSPALHPALLRPARPVRQGDHGPREGRDHHPDAGPGRRHPRRDEGPRRARPRPDRLRQDARLRPADPGPPRRRVTAAPSTRAR